MERKTLDFSACEIRTEGDARVFAGYASKFGGDDSYGDTIHPGAFAETIAKHGMPKMLFQHDYLNLPVGKYAEIAEDKKGLFVKGELTSGMSRADDVYAALKHQTIDGLSIGFMLQKGDYEEKAKGSGRNINRVSELLEISIVTFPADRRARIDAVKAEAIEELETIRDVERFLRDAGGLTKGLAAAVISRVKLILSPGEPDKESREAKEIREIAARIARFKVPTLE